MKKYLFFLFVLGFSLTASGQDMINLHKHIVKAKNPTYNDDFELGLQMASKFILENHHLRGSQEYRYAVLIVEYWKDKEKWFAIPTGSSFDNSIKSDKNLTLLNVAASMNYIITQKLEKKRYLKCLPIKGQKQAQQKDCREVQLNAAKTVLSYCNTNKVTVPAETQKYLDAYNKGTLDKLFFKK